MSIPSWVIEYCIEDVRGAKDPRVQKHKELDLVMDLVYFPFME
jgi:hypothetical protein